MRITTAAKSATRKRILQVTAALLQTKGYDATTIRDIARKARIASGTLFNYFPNKEAVAVELMASVLERARTKFHKQRPAPRSFEEALFSLIALELRHLRPYRTCVPLLQTALSPSTAKPEESDGQIRRQHSEVVMALACRYRIGALSPVAQQLYWTLYTGVLSFWATDSSPRQEDTLALLDQSLAMFVAWLTNAADAKS